MKGGQERGESGNFLELKRPKSPVSHITTHEEERVHLHLIFEV